MFIFLTHYHSLLPILHYTLIQKFSSFIASVLGFLKKKIEGMTVQWRIITDFVNDSYDNTTSQNEGLSNAMVEMLRV